MGIRRPQGAAIDLPLGFVGAQTFTSDQGNLNFSFNVPGARSGDLLCIAFCFDSDFDGSWSWASPSISWSDTSSGTVADALDITGGFFSLEVAGYESWAIWDGSTTNIETTGVGSTSWKGLSGVVSVFRGEDTVDDFSWASSGSGMPDPPSCDPGSALYVTTGFLDDDAITMTAPSSWTLAATTNHTFFGSTTSIGVAYNYGSLNNPGAFGGGGSDQNAGINRAFS